MHDALPPALARLLATDRPSSAFDAWRALVAAIDEVPPTAIVEIVTVVDEVLARQYGGDGLWFENDERAAPAQWVHPQPSPALLLAHDLAPIRAMVWHPDGEHLVCGSWDFVPKMIDARNGRCVRAWQGHAHWVDALSIDAEGRRLITGSSAHTVRVWDLDSEDCLAVFELGWPELSDVMLDQGEILAACRDEIVILPLPARS